MSGKEAVVTTDANPGPPDHAPPPPRPGGQLETTKGLGGWEGQKSCSFVLSSHYIA